MPPTLSAYIWQNSRRGQIVPGVLTVAVSFLTAVPLQRERGPDVIPPAYSE